MFFSMNYMDYIPLLPICAPIIALVIFGILKSKNNSMQHKSSKGGHTAQKTDKCKNYTTNNSSLFEKNYSDDTNSRRGKRRKSRNAASKQKDKSNNNKTIQVTNSPDRRRLSVFPIKNWLKDYYEREFITSCVKDIMTSRHISAHHSNTSSEAVASNVSCVNKKDLSSIYLRPKQISKQATKTKPNKQPNFKKQPKSTTVPTNLVVMNVKKDNKDIDKLNGAKHTAAGGGTLNLSKQYAKAVAIKAILNKRKISNSCTSDYNSSASSSAESSPMHSVSSSPSASPTTTLKRGVAKSMISSLRQFSKLNMNEQEFAQQMQRYIIDPSLLKVYGFPVESIHYEDCVEIYKCLPKHLAEEAVAKDNKRHHRHFYGRKTCNIVNTCDDLSSGVNTPHRNSYGSIDSGHGSGDSSPRFSDSDSSEMSEEYTVAPIMAFYTPDGVYQIFSEYRSSIEKQCVRCSKKFKVNRNGQYLTYDRCTYHWGKPINVYNGKYYTSIYSCCQREKHIDGCSKHDLHVWSGVIEGINGPYTDFVRTQNKKTKQRRHPKVYALDCEMSYTGLGLEVTKITVVSYNGSLVYEHFVRPQAKIIDYNTRFSGVSENDLSGNSKNSVKTFAEVQNDLLNLFDADTILIGHGLDNDLRVLRLIHKTVVDTSLVFSHSTGYPYKRSLKNLTKSFLNRDIQCSDTGHSSFEDSKACLELMIWKVRKDLRHWND